MKVVLIAQVTRSGSRERGFLGSPPPLIYSSSYPRKLFFEGSPNLLPPVPCIRGSHPLFRLLTFSLFLIVKYLALLCYLPPISPSYHLFRNSHLAPFPLPSLILLPPPLLPGPHTSLLPYFFN